MNYQQLVVLTVIAICFAYGSRPNRKIGTIARSEDDTDKGCALIAGVILALIAFIFWDVP